MKFRTAATAALALTAALVLAGCSAGNDDGSMPGMDHGASEQAADVNDADVMFASMMIVHHEQAIQMRRSKPPRGPRSNSSRAGWRTGASIPRSTRWAAWTTATG